MQKGDRMGSNFNTTKEDTHDILGLQVEVNFDDYFTHSNWKLTMPPKYNYLINFYALEDLSEKSCQSNEKSNYLKL